ncbi:NAD-dependent protein deacetylase sirtuin-1-like protein [Leptotrombidium deliense]|uniref:protein acetyllysine N-acetyltransferase n=1 Tax=Leptotrombidium deliense TaxID=299467 RepID=A0A443SNF9_9ACAR|nr:NAD-dependent protein deacetylase sirtuin-1-like protein [Leptotrombidium deliense]
MENERREESDHYDFGDAPLVKKSRLSPRIRPHFSPLSTQTDECGTKSAKSPLFAMFEVSSSTHCDVDINGGDSGFQELSSNSTPEEEANVAASVGNQCDPSVDNTDRLSDDGSDISDISCGSYLSNISGENWKPVVGPLGWVQQQITFGTNPRDILQEMVPNACISPDVENLTLWKLIVNILSEPPRRRKLQDVNTLDDVVRLIRKCNRIIVLTGAGVSVSCGIPDFRSRDGIYARLSKDFPDLPDPQSMFDIQYFRRDQRPFFKFAKEIFPGLFLPSPSHKFIKNIEKHGKLLRNYSQNIDTLEKAAGIEKVITCHGSFSTATCTRCKHKVDASVIKDDVFAQRIPRCTLCPSDTEEMAVLKPDIVFFGEGLSDEFHEAMSADKNICDLLIVMGSSLKVRPVALIPSSIPSTVPQILINREKLHHLTFDVELLGDCDVIVQELLGEDWNEDCNERVGLSEISVLPDSVNESDSLEINNNDGSDKNEVGLSSELEEKSASHDLSLNVYDSELPDSASLQPDSTSKDIFEADLNASSTSIAIAERLPANSYLFLPPHQYIFSGAEVCEDDLKVDDKFDEDSCNSSSPKSENLYKNYDYSFIITYSVLYSLQL